MTDNNSLDIHHSRKNSLAQTIDKLKMDDRNMSEDIDLILFIFYGILIPIIAIFGCIGNLLSVYIIMK